MDFCSQPAALLIEIRIAGSVPRVADRLLFSEADHVAGAAGGRNWFDKLTTGRKHTVSMPKAYEERSIRAQSKVLRFAGFEFGR
jgi:hypothetical protein